MIRIFQLKPKELTMLRIAMLSFAHVHADGYAKRIVEHPEAKIQCIWDDDTERGKMASERWNAPLVSDLDQVVGNSDVDAVVICAETSKHPMLIKAALEYEKHIFTEKALTITTAEANEIVKLVNESGCKFMICLPRRTAPEILFAKQVLDKGWLGKVTTMRARLAHMAALDGWFTEESHNAWFVDRQLAGGGALFDVGCHAVDVMRWFLGKPKSLIAKIQNFSQAHDIDDNAAIVIEFKNGALGILEASFVQRVGPNPFEICGTDGYLGSDSNGDWLLNSTQLQAEGIQGYIRPTKLPDALPHPVEQWIGAILHDTSVTITVEDGRNLTRILEAAYQSAREGREIAF
jgi:predicted dehydrogenase